MLAVFVAAYNDGVQRELFALEGTIPVKFRGKYGVLYLASCLQLLTFSLVWSSSVVHEVNFQILPNATRKTPDSGIPISLNVISQGWVAAFASQSHMSDSLTSERTIEQITVTMPLAPITITALVLH